MEHFSQTYSAILVPLSFLGFRVHQYLIVITLAQAYLIPQTFDFFDSVTTRSCA